MGPYHHTNHDLLDHGILSDDDLAQFPEDLLVPMLEFFYERCILADDLLDVFHPQTPPFFGFSVARAFGFTTGKLRIPDCGLSYQAFRYLPIRNPQSPIRNPLVSQRVYNIVHAVFIGLVGFFDGHERIVGPLPVLADIVVVIDHHHEALLVVAHAQVLGNEAASVRRWRQQVRDIIETLEYLVRAGQLLKGVLRKHHLQLRFEVFDLALPPEVVHDQKTSAQEILAHVVRLFLGQVQKPYLAEIRNRILEDLVVVKGNNMSFAVDVELGDLRKDLHVVLVSRWILVTPRRTLPAKSPPVQARSRVPDTRQRKLVFHQRRFILRHDSQRDEGGSYRA